jgi:hypothetical protein
MVSRKTSQGKARKSAKSKANDEKEDATLEAHMEKLEINNYLTFCTHGSIPLPKGRICQQFVRQFEKHYHNSTSDRLLVSLEQAYQCTKEN